MKRKTAHANVAQAVQLMVIWGKTADLSKGNEVPLPRAQGADSERIVCGQRKSAACPAGVRA
ncbi:hypothetical protein ELG83_15995 [Rhizobium leguminosarum]|nr:hypothetical protein [Rhizobium leguminosarum bv. viciae]TBF36782.1 hypothetical protein ELG88_16920 [Rhizobium leguminosarum]NKL55937.1 hypothetical protein [Rhizobium leguminosarum bv. viciae]TBF41629.1 hypothetical protein ELG92_16915 [Rhizobium leguminosarum]TBF53214.1 hypothetical protein ELG91_16320 [Rhizobium leguminosarum]